MGSRVLHKWFPKIHRCACGQRNSMNVGGISAVDDWSRVTCKKCLARRAPR
jgi:hypothetical protein